MKKIRKAVIPAAGYGTRFLPATKALAKEMLPIIDTPTIEYIVDEAVKSGIEEILIIVSSNKNSIMDHFDDNLELSSVLVTKNKKAELEMISNNSRGVNIHYIRQKTMRGLGDAILHAKAFISDEPFAILLGDDVYVSDKEYALKQLIDAYNVTGTSVVGVLPIEGKDISKYGVISPGSEQVIDGVIHTEGFVEKPKFEEAPSNLAIGGRYIVTPRIFKILEEQEPGVGGEIQLTDALNKLCTFEKMYSCEVDAKRYDIGSRIGFIEATLDFALKRDDLKEQVIDLLKKKDYINSLLK